MSSDDQSDRECPLCMEAFDIDDINFFPCNCQYQICRFCWHRIRTNENGLCPACRQSYPENPVNFQPLSSAELQKIKTEKKQKVQREKSKLIESRKYLSEFRVLQKNLVYVVGLNKRIADPELLKKPEFFGKFGKIIKIAVGTAQAINNNTPPTHTAYVTYSRSEDALRTIEAVNNMVVDGRLLKASLGTTKYCSNFLKGQACNKPECMYLHEVAEGEISFTKEDMHQGKHTDYERRLHEQIAAVSSSQQQNASYCIKNAGKEHIAKSRTRTAEEKKRSTVGSSENLATKQKQKKAGSAGAFSIKTGWNEQKTRGGSEARDLHRNESAKAMVINETKRGSKTSVKSVSPPTASSGIDDAKNGMTNRDGGVAGSSSHCSTEARDTSPISMSFSIGEQMGLAGGGRSESNPPPMYSSASSPSPTPSEFAITLAKQLTNGTETTTITSISSKHSLEQNRQQYQQKQPIDISHPFNSSINFFLDHEDDLGFDPFAESAKGLEQMIEEEKHFTPPTNSNTTTSRMSVGATISSHNNFFTSNAGDNYSSSIFNNQQPPPPPGLHSAFIGQNHFEQLGDTSEFLNMFDNKMHGDSSGNLSMSDLRESFKAMLPNVNIRFLGESSNEGIQHSQQQLHNQMQQLRNENANCGGSFFGAVGGNHSSTNSLPTIPSGYPRTQTTNQFHSFTMDQEQFQQQQRHLQQHPFGRHSQQFQHMGTSNNFGGTSNRPFHQQQLNGFMTGTPQQQSSSSYREQQLGQRQHYFGGIPHQNNLYQDRQRYIKEGGSINSGTMLFSPQDAEQQDHSWLPVPPGFQPRTTQ